MFCVLFNHKIPWLNYSKVHKDIIVRDKAKEIDFTQSRTVIDIQTQNRHSKLIGKEGSVPENRWIPHEALL